LSTRRGEDVANVLRQGVGGRVAVAADRQAEVAEIVIHVVVAVPATMALRETEGHDGAAGLGEVLRRGEDRLARLSASAGAGIDAPGRFLLAIDGILDRARDATAFRAVIEVRLQGTFWIRVVRGRLFELHLGFLAGILG